VQETPEAALVAAQTYLLTTQPEPRDPWEHMHQAAIRSLRLVEGRLNCGYQTMYNMRGRKKIMWTMKNRWARYDLPEGFAEHEYPKDLNYHTINRSMMGHKDLNCGYQTTYKQYKNTQRNKSNGDAKLAVTPHRRSTVLVKHSTQRFHRKLGRTRESIHKKFSFDIQTSSVARRNQVLHTEEGQNSMFIHTVVEYNKKL
jgi:hypothetical protein